MSIQEKGQSAGRAQEVVNGLLFGERKTLGVLLDKRKNPRVLSAFRDAVSTFLPEEAVDLTSILLKGLGTDGNIWWNVDRRDGALELLGAIPFEEKVEPDVLLEKYLASVDSLKKSSDPLGSVHSLAEAGMILAQYFPLTEEGVFSVTNAWMQLQKRLYDHPEFSVVAQKSGELAARLKELKKDSDSAVRRAANKDAELSGDFSGEEKKAKSRRKRMTHDEELKFRQEVASRLSDVHNPRARKILEMSFGINGEQRSNQQIADELGVAVTTVSRIKNERLAELGLRERQKMA